MFTKLIRVFYEGMGNVEYDTPGGAGTGGTVLTAANNGLSVSTVAPNIVVLGNDQGNTTAQLLSTREIPMNSQNIIFSGMSNPGGGGMIVFQLKAGTSHLSGQIVWQAPNGGGGQYQVATMSADDDGAGNGSLYWGKNAGQNATGNNLGNVGIGQLALSKNTTGIQNTAIGLQALAIETTGLQNTAVGNQALQAQVGGQYNVALGWQAGYNLVNGIDNTILGAFTSGQYSNSSSNVVIGAAAGTPYLAAAFVANNNVIIGTFCQSANSVYGNANVLIGDSINNNTGGNTITNNNILIGANIAASSTIGVGGGTLNNTTVIGQGMTTTRSNVARIGRADQNIQLGWTVDVADSGARLQVNGAIQTTPPNVTAGKVRFGIEVAAAITANLTRYLEIEYDGVLYKLVTAN